jgi:eukaryotic-like serine/threonine-protein kinase
METTSMLSHDSAPAWAGSVLLADTYLLGRRLSGGGMSETFEATHARLPGRFAVKILAPDLAGNREAFARFCREAEILSELRHPNVVQIFDFNTAPDERPYFVMEYLEGRDLETRLADSGQLSLPAAVRVVEAVASALAAAHAHGIVHRDLKPANIFLCAVDGQPDELVKVLDFGISKIRATTTLASVPPEVLGSPPYMSPEQARGATDQIDGRTDQFALGAIAYRMLTGHDAFTGTDVSSLLHQIVNEEPQPLAHHLPVSWDARPLQAVFDRALAKDPADRWGGMMELARAFEAAAERTLSSSAPIALESAPPAPAAIAIESAPPLPAPIAHEIVRPLSAPIALDTVRPLPPSEPISPVRKRPSPPAIAVEGRLPIPDDLDLSDTLDDRIPGTHHRAAALGTIFLMAAGLLIATGWYRKIPGAIPRVRQSLAAWLPPKSPTQPMPVPLPDPAKPPQPVAPEPSVVAAQSAPTPPSPPPAEPVAAQAPAPEPSAPAAVAVAAPRHHHAATTGSRFRGHPGSIELAPPGPGDPTPPAMPDGFPIEPPATLADTPARDLVPTAEPQAPPSSPPADAPLSDAPLPPSTP